MYCKNCGKEILDGSKYCDKCGCLTEQPQNNPSVASEHNGANEEKNRCLPAFILGLIGSIFGMFGGFCMTMCAGVFSSSASNFAFLFIFCGSILGLVGACMCLSKAFRGSIMQLIAALLIIIYAYGMVGAEFMTILSMLLFLAGGITGLIFSFINKSKK